MILLLGSDNLAPALRALGGAVVTCGPEPEADLPCQAADPDWAQLEPVLRQRGLKPEAILITDHIGCRRLPTGLWNAPVPVVFYGLDSPLNWFWQESYARLADRVWFDQKAEADRLGEARPEVGWLPVAVDQRWYEGERPPQTRRAVAFVGVVNDQVRPKRGAVLARVAARAPLELRGGHRERWFDTAQAAQLYRECRVVLNENLFPGVTTRPLEVMAAGGCCLTEAAPGSMEVFFRDGAQLAYYGPEDLESRLDELLDDEPRCARLARDGRELVLAQHTFAQRAQTLAQHLCPEGAGGRRLGGAEALAAEGRAMVMAGLRWPGEAGALRLERGLGRLEAVANGLPDPGRAWRAAAWASLTLGRVERGVAYLAATVQAGDPADRLAWGLALERAGQATQARQAWASLEPRDPDLGGRGGRARFHLAAGRVLARSGRDLVPGFDRSRLHPAAWYALEHLLEATRLDPGLAPAWELAGDLLLWRGGANQAHFCYVQAARGGPSQELAAKTREAARRGYLT